MTSRPSRATSRPTPHGSRRSSGRRRRSVRATRGCWSSRGRPSGSARSWAPRRRSNASSWTEPRGRSPPRRRHNSRESASMAYRGPYVDARAHAAASPRRESRERDLMSRHHLGALCALAVALSVIAAFAPPAAAWTPAVQISEGSDPSWASDGAAAGSGASLYVVYLAPTDTEDRAVRLRQSKDGGATFLPSIILSDAPTRGNKPPWVAA